MSIEIPTISLVDSIKFNLFHVLPFVQKGIFTRNPKRYSFLTKIQRDPLSYRFIASLRRKYNSSYLYLWMLNKKTLLVLDGAGIEHILDHSPENYAETAGKRKGMSRFQPNALTISRGEEWKDRRRFNEAVLHNDSGPPPFADNFLGVIQEEVRRAESAGYGLERWTDFARLFNCITVKILFGKELEDTFAADQLKLMMLDSNRLISLSAKSEHFDAFYGRIAEYLNAPAGHCLAARCQNAPSSAITKIENQIPHWIFAMGDTLAINTVAALALICAHTDSEQRIRKDLEQSPPESAKNIQKLQYLEGCIQEAMRLWPSTLLLMREAIADDQIGDYRIPAGTQIMIHNGFNHRDETTHDFAGRFHPEFWLDKKSDYQFNHLSNGPQVCAGKDLALFVAKAVLAALLGRNRFRLEHPQLKAGDYIPQGFDHFGIRFERVALH